MDDCLSKDSIAFASPRGVRQKAGPVLEVERCLGGADPGRPLDECHRRVEADARRRLGQGLRGQQHHLPSPARTTSCSACWRSFFGPDAINDRLMLIETMGFTTTPDEMLESMTRIIADRSVGSIVFGNYHLMDYELMGSDGPPSRSRPKSAKARGPSRSCRRWCRSARTKWPTLVTPRPRPRHPSRISASSCGSCPAGNHPAGGACRNRRKQPPASLPGPWTRPIHHFCEIVVRSR